MIIIVQISDHHLVIIFRKISDLTCPTWSLHMLSYIRTLLIT